MNVMIGMAINNDSIIEEHEDYNIEISAKRSVEMNPLDEDFEMTDEQFLVYPNPVQDIFTVDFVNEQQGFEIMIFDIQGRLVSFFNGTDVARVKVDMEGMRPGNYFVKVKNGRGSMRIIQMAKL